MEIIEALQSLGLNDKEARVYVGILRLGRGSAYAIADEAGLKKPTTYVILGELIRKGLVNRVPRVRKQLFVAKSPEEFFALAEERLSIAKTTLPQLMAIAEGETPKPRTLFFEGLQGIRDAFLSQAKRMQGKEMVGFYAHADDASDELLEFFDEYNNDLKRRKVRVRGITPDHPSIQRYMATNVEHRRTLKLIPFEEYSSDISLDIGEQHVMFFAFRDLQATVIENEHIARTMKQFFEMVWKCRPEKAQGAEAES